MMDENAAIKSPWHDGERIMQQRAGVATQMEAHGRKVLRDYLTEQHRTFFPQLPFIIVGTVDDEGRPWASLMEGQPGFLHSPDDKHLRIASTLHSNDPAKAGLHEGSSVGLLGIELHTRRRNRLNGVIQRSTEAGYEVAVKQSFGNCPQYLQKRTYWFSSDHHSESLVAPEVCDSLDTEAVEFITSADTCFVASYIDKQGDASQRSVDVSHRGGRPGFIKVENGVLTIPDWSGNLYFNTLGNLLVNPKAGMLFINFDTGDVLQIWGSTEIVFDGKEVSSIQGAERIWRVKVLGMVRRRGALSLRWDFNEFSPNSLEVGVWPGAQTSPTIRLSTWAPFRVTRIHDESRSIRSFYLEPVDQSTTVDFNAGQYLPIRIKTDAETPPQVRTYTVSSAPSDRFLRISVKREGVVSTFFHDKVRVGDTIEARQPVGNFTLDPDIQRPLVLLSVGVGVTPMLAMLRELVNKKHQHRSMRKTYFLHGSRSKSEQPFSEEISVLQRQAGASLTVVYALSQPEPDLTEGVHFDRLGRIDIDVLKRTLPFDDYEFFLCGPSSFTQSLYDNLRKLNVLDMRIHSESFGPSGLVRTPDPTHQKSQEVHNTVATKPVNVVFSASRKEVEWHPGKGTLLDLAEANGITPEFSCRSGVCGACQTKVISGDIAYEASPTASVEAEKALICCAFPANSESDNPIVSLEL